MHVASIDAAGWINTTQAITRIFGSDRGVHSIKSEDGTATVDAPYFVSSEPPDRNESQLHSHSLDTHTPHNQAEYG